MSTQSKSRWYGVADEVGLVFEDGESPEPRMGSWTRALTHFSRHSFARVFFSPLEKEASVLVEVALGPPGAESDAVARAVQTYLSQISQSNWSAEVKVLPWRFETRLNSEDGGVERFALLLKELVALTERFDAVTSAGQWLEILGGGDPGQSSVSEKESVKAAGSVFEDIGAQASAIDEGGAFLSATALERSGGEVRIALGLTSVIPPTELAELIKALSAHLRTKFEAQARPAEAVDRPSLRLPSSARTAVQLVVEPGDYGGSLGALAADLGEFLERLEKFSAHGVDLFEYLGVHRQSDVKTTGQTLRQPPRTTSASTSPALPVADSLEQPVVLGLEPRTSAGSSLQPGNFEDERLRREDATTALVDLVLRHPGYSDRRIGQVLSILLSIEYHQAVELSQRAPCVIAWGVGNQRAQSFKEVIESAGGKALLVEPGTF